MFDSMQEDSAMVSRFDIIHEHDQLNLIVMLLVNIEFLPKKKFNYFTCIKNGNKEILN
jgi:hypothetical protein